jgi:serine/threonine protein phosphatase 1
LALSAKHVVPLILECVSITLLSAKYYGEQVNTYTYVIGDVHGCYNELMTMTDLIFKRQVDKIIMLGDYIDRGFNSKQVIEYCIDFKQQLGDKFIALKGNHEDMCLYDVQTWMNNGGRETMESYGGYDALIPDEHIAFMRNLPEYHETENFIFAHAGVQEMPFVPMNEQPSHALLWKRYPKNYSPDIPKTLIHGHTPQMEVEITEKRVNIDTACVFGNKLTCAIIQDDKEIVEYLTVKSGVKR